MAKYEVRVDRKMMSWEEFVRSADALEDRPVSLYRNDRFLFVFVVRDTNYDVLLKELEETIQSLDVHRTENSTKFTILNAEACNAYVVTFAAHLKPTASNVIKRLLTLYLDFNGFFIEEQIINLLRYTLPCFEKVDAGHIIEW